MLSDEYDSMTFYLELESLNPCSNGICSLTDPKELGGWISQGLNPCSNGICSLTNTAKNVSARSFAVLILVLMEYAL